MPALLGSTRKQAGIFYNFGEMGYNTKHPNAGMVCDSIVDDRAAFDTLVNTTMQPNGGIVEVVGVPRLGSAVAVPKNVQLKFINGAYLAPDVATTTTINGTVNPELEKKFGGGGSIVFGGGKIKEVFPQWWGATGDGVTDDKPAFQSAGDSLFAYGQQVSIPVPNSSYLFSSTVTITKRGKWVGLGGKLGVPIICGTTNGAFTATFTGGYLEFENLFIQGDPTVGSLGKAINIVGTSIGAVLENVIISNCFIKNFSDPIVLKYVSHVLLENVLYFQGISGRTTGACFEITFSEGVELRKCITSGSGAVLPIRSVHVGSNVDTLFINGCEFYRTGGIIINNLEAGTTFAPRYIKIDNIDVEQGQGVDATNDVCINILAGDRIMISNSSLLSGFYGIQISGGKQISVIGGEVYNNQQHGIFVGAAATGVELAGIKVFDNSQLATNTYRGIIFSGACSDFSITGCSIRSNVQNINGVLHQYHLSIGAGSTNFIIDGVRMNAAGTNAVNLPAGLLGTIKNLQCRDGWGNATITLTAGTTSVIANKNVHAYCQPTLTPLNAAAQALGAVRLSAATLETSFTLTHPVAAGTETYYAVMG